MRISHPVGPPADRIANPRGCASDNPEPCLKTCELFQQGRARLNRPMMKNLLEQARTVMPGGAFTTYVLDEEVDLVIKNGKGSKVYDVNGREYIDCINGSGPMLLGHARPEVVEAVRQMAECPSNYYFLNEKGIELAQMLVDAIPCAEQVKYGVSGSDANLYALRLARAYTGKTKVLKFEGGFLGGLDQALMSMAPQAPFPDYPLSAPDSAGIPRAAQDDVLIAPYNNLAVVEAIVGQHHAEIAAIIVEAEQRCIPPKAGFLQGLRDLCDRYGIILIFDEIVTGFRLSWQGAQGRFGVTPDMASYGKVIGGGQALSAVAGPREIMRLCNPREDAGPQQCFTGNTLCGNAMASAAGIATLKVLGTSGTYERLEEIGQKFRAGVAKAFADCGEEGQALGLGPVSVIVNTNAEIVDYRSSIASDRKRLRRIMTEMVKRGVLTNGKFYLSLAMSDADIDLVHSALEDSIRAVQRNEG